MRETSETQREILLDLGEGLILRRATSADAEALAVFNSKIHSDAGPDSPDLAVAAWTRDLLEKPHPTMKPGDITIVEEVRTGKIISSMNLIPQTWSYAGIEFAVGRPELVGTLPEYRNRGLVRAQFEVVHCWSAQRGHLLQGITGIPYYYRLFGYEMAVNLGHGRSGYRPHIPRLPEGESEPYQVRPAQAEDLPFIAQVTEYGGRRSLLNCVRDEAQWTYELSGKSAENVTRSELRIIDTPAGEPVGYFIFPPFMWGSMLAVTMYELKPGVPWTAVTPTVIRAVEKEAEKLVAKADGRASFESFGFWLHSEHPVFSVLHDRLPRERKPYAWYLRVPDLPGFLRHIAPGLEARLAESALAGYTGELQITFYRTGLRLALEGGRLAVVEAWRPEPTGQAGQAGFPGLTFLQLLFGYRSLEELTYAFPDCWANTDDAWALLNVLFPKQASDIWALG